MRLTEALAAAVHHARLTWAGWVWLGWVFFGVVWELVWLAVNAYNTLSSQVWALERINFAHPLDFAEWTPAHFTIAIVLWLFFAWLSVHFAFGWLRA